MLAMMYFFLNYNNRSILEGYEERRSEQLVLTKGI